MKWLDALSNPSFMPHGHCYLWRPDILWTHVISDATVALAYFAIPVALGVVLYRRREAIPHADILCLFIAFILLCGLTHLMSIYVVWHPAYEFQGWLKAATAIVSLATALALAPRLPQLIAGTAMQLDNAQLRNALQDAEQKNRDLDALMQPNLEREQRILELKQEVNALLADKGLPARYLADTKSGTSASTGA